MNKNIPFNLAICNKGRSIYIFPRKFENERENKNIGAAWMELCGLVVIKTEKEYNELKVKKVENIL